MSTRTGFDPAAAHQVVASLAATGDAEQVEWLDRIHAAIDVAADPDRASDSAKLRAIATHYDAHDRQSAQAGDPPRGTDFLHDLADRLDTLRPEWSITFRHPDIGVRQHDCPDEAAARAVTDSLRRRLTRPGSHIALSTRQVGPWKELP